MQKIGLAIVSPSGYAIAPERLNQAQKVFADYGFDIINFYDHSKHYQRFGDTDAGRVAQINVAINHPDVQVIMALRGGYGASRIVHLLDFKAMALSGKVFVGHSDFTVIEMGLLACGAKSLAGPMVFPDFSRDDISPLTLGHFTDAIKGLPIHITWASNMNPKVDVSGTFWGGNLTMLSHLVGTPWMPAISNGILFVEDVHEHPYRVERMLIQLAQAGILSKQRALILGQMNDYTLSDYDNGYDFNAMLKWLRDYLSIPVLTGLPFGHVRDKVTLPIGANASLICDGQTVNLKFA